MKLSWEWRADRVELGRLPRRLLILPIRVYQYVLSPLIGPRCRFAPSCSAYAAEALSTHGAVRGGWLAIRRIARCHPWGGFGYDPVPENVPPLTGPAGRKA